MSNHAAQGQAHDRDSKQPAATYPALGRAAWSVHGYGRPGYTPARIRCASRLAQHCNCALEHVCQNKTITPPRKKLRRPGSRRKQQAVCHRRPSASTSSKIHPYASPVACWAAVVGTDGGDRRTVHVCPGQPSTPAACTALHDTARLSTHLCPLAHGA